MKLCIRAHDLGTMGTDGIIKRIKELELDGIQLVVYKVYKDVPYNPGAITREKAVEIGKAMKEAGVLVPYVGAYFNPIHSNVEKRNNCKKIFKDYIRNSDALGSFIVGSETGSYNDDNWNYNPKNRTDEALNRVTEVFTELADEAEKNNTFIAIEGAAGHVCYDVKTLKKALDAINRDNVKVIFDLFNYMDEGNQHNYLDILDEGIKTFGDKILLFHMKDCKFNKNGAPEFVPYGEGEMDLKEILKRIKAHNKDAILTLEDTTGEYIKSGSKLIREIWETV